MSAYLDSLRRLRELDLEVIRPGHGPFVWDPYGKIDEYLAHRLDRERKVVEAIEAVGAADRNEVLDRAWDDVDFEAVPMLRFAAAATLEGAPAQAARGGAAGAGALAAGARHPRKRRRPPTFPTAPFRPTQPMQATQPSQSTQPMQATHAEEFTLPSPATMPALVTVPALNTTPALATVAALPTTPALATVPALLTTPALATVPALPITPALATVPAAPITPALATVAAESLTPVLDSSLTSSGVWCAPFSLTARNLPHARPQAENTRRSRLSRHAFQPCSWRSRDSSVWRPLCTSRTVVRPSCSANSTVTSDSPVVPPGMSSHSQV